MHFQSRNQPCPCGSGKKFKHCCASKKGASSAQAFQTSKPALLSLPGRGSFPLSNALQIAIQHHQLGQLRKASEIYELILKQQPDHIDALHLQGVIMHQLGKHDLAYPLIEKAISLNPNVASLYNNFGEVCRAMRKVDEAYFHYEKALSIQPNFPEAERNIGLTLREQGKSDEALLHFKNAIAHNPNYLDAYLALGETLHSQRNFEDALEYYRQALAFAPDNPALLCQIGIALRANGKLDDAIQHYQKAIVLQPGVPALYTNLALIHEAMGNRPGAATCYRKVLELKPDDESAQHLLNALEHVNSERAPAAYVRETFDNYASNFEHHLIEKLEYQMPTLLCNEVKDILGQGSCPLDILDLGCGTGLFGVQVKTISKRLVGIDLAPKMVEKAQEKKIYDQLIVGDLLEFLAEAETDCFDLIAAADVFNYLGNLLPVFEQCKRVLRPHGLFAFSLEAHSDDEKDFTLDSTGRYLHSSDYIRQLSKEFEFAEARFTPTTIRKQHNKPVKGYLCLLKKNNLG